MLYDDLLHHSIVVDLTILIIAIIWTECHALFLISSGVVLIIAITRQVAAKELWSCYRYALLSLYWYM